MTTSILEITHEHKLRSLALEIAKGIKAPAEAMQEMGMEEIAWESLENSRAFKEMLNAASAEWNGANNTQKRVRLKAAVNVEQALPSFYVAMIDGREALASRVKVLEIMSKIGNLGVPEPIVGANNGQYFKLEIHMDGKSPIITEFGGAIFDNTLNNTSSDTLESKSSDISVEEEQSEPTPRLEIEEIEQPVSNQTIFEKPSEITPFNSLSSSGLSSSGSSALAPDEQTKNIWKVESTQVEEALKPVNFGKKPANLIASRRLDSEPWEEL